METGRVYPSVTIELQTALEDGETLAVTQIQGALNYLAQAQRLAADEIRALLDQMIEQLPSANAREQYPTASNWLN